MSAHTPGPWHYGHSVNCPGQFFIGQPQHCVTLAHVHNFPDDQREANARLIAAAPAMDLCLSLIARGAARIERSGTLIEFCFRGIRYAFNEQTSWSGIVDAIGWDKARAAVAALTEPRP